MAPHKFFHHGQLQPMCFFVWGEVALRELRELFRYQTDRLVLLDGTCRGYLQGVPCFSCLRRVLLVGYLGRRANTTALPLPRRQATK